MERFAAAQPITINPLIHLEVISIAYFLALMYYRKKYGGKNGELYQNQAKRVEPISRGTRKKMRRFPSNGKCH